MAYCSKNLSSFTLTEMLVVICIIAVLAALLIPGISGMITKANTIQCASNLHQVGVAIQMYTGENDGYLPGPLVGAQPPCYRPYPSDCTLLTYIAPYLNLPQGDGITPVRAAVFVCPGWVKAIPPGADQPSSEHLAVGRLDYLMQYLANGTDNLPPFGAPYGGEKTIQPTKLMQIRNPTTTYAICDFDRGSSPYGILPPVHGKKLFRNYLYFDWHVETRTNQ